MDEGFLIELRKCRGVPDAAMAYMLQTWILALGNSQPYPGLQKVADIRDDFHLTTVEVEDVCASVIEVVYGHELHSVLTHKDRSVHAVSCEVRNSTAWIKLQWK